MSIFQKAVRIKLPIPRKYSIFLLSVILIVCYLSVSSAAKQKGGILAAKPQAYHEIETDFDMEKDYNRPIEDAMAEEIAGLKEKGNDFWYDQSRQAVMRESMQDVYGRIKCKEEKCFIVGTEVKGRMDYLRPLLPEWKIGDCQAVGYDYWCAITEPNFSEAMIKISEQSWLLDNFYIFGKDIYAVGTPKSNDNYSVFKNGKEIFSRNMDPGTENIFEASMVLNSPAFTFYEPIYMQSGIGDGANSNIWYNGETINEKYGIESSSFLFSYKDKIGFVGGKGGKKFFFFNGQKVSQDFDEIRTHSCCAIQSYPVELDQNGILFFLGRRGERYFFTEVDLNKYL